MLTDIKYGFNLIHYTRERNPTVTEPIEAFHGSQTNRRFGHSSKEKCSIQRHHMSRSYKVAVNVDQ